MSGRELVLLPQGFLCSRKRGWAHHTQPDPKSQPRDLSSFCKAGTLQLWNYWPGELIQELPRESRNWERCWPNSSCPISSSLGVLAKQLLVIHSALSVEGQDQAGICPRAAGFMDSETDSPKALLTPAGNTRNTSNSFPNWTIVPHEHDHGMP